MNQRGEVTLLSVMCLVIMTGILLLCSLELQRSFKSLTNRTSLFLCAKESKGELQNYLKLMGRSNWAIKNTNRAALIMMFIPGLQGAAMDAQKIKSYLAYYQNLKLVSYLKSLKTLGGSGCFLDPRMYITPYQTSATGYVRDKEGAALLRSNEWNYIFLKGSYSLKMEVNARGLENVRPRMKIQVSEKGAKLSSLLSSRF